MASRSQVAENMQADAMAPSVHILPFGVTAQEDH